MTIFALAAPTSGLAETVAAPPLDALKAAERRASRALAAIGPRLVAHEARVAGAERRAERLETEATAADARRARAESDLARLLARAQRIAREPTPALVIHPDRPLDAARSAAMLRALSTQLKAAAARAAAERDGAARALDEARRSAIAARAARDALRRDEMRAERLLAARAAARAQAQARIDAQKRAVEERAVEKRALEDRAAEERAAQAAERLAAAPPAPRGLMRESTPAPEAATEPAPPPEALLETESLAPTARLTPLETTPLPPDAPFSEARGRVLRPVAGETERRASAATPGIFFATRPFARVIAPWGGRVRYVGPFRHEGVLVIIEPQRGYEILLSGLGETSLAEGDEVLAGEPIGRMGGPTPSSSEFLFEITAATRDHRETLYLEIIDNGRPADPTPWLQRQEVSGL